MKRASLVVVALVAAMFAVAFAAAPASAVLAVNVTPNANLVDGQSVSVTASGYTADAQIAIIECQSGAVSQDNCDLSTVLITSADGSGNVSESYSVFRVIQPAASATPIDCAPANCLLVVANIVDQTEAFGQTLNFDASIPPPPPLVVTVALSNNATFDRAGDVTLTGTANCSIPADLSLDGLATQRAGRALYNAEGFTDISCDGPTSFTVVATPYNGIFRGGKADVQLYWNAFAGNRSVFGEVDTTVALSGGGNGGHGHT